MNRPTILLTHLLADAGRLCGVSTTRDVDTVRHRIKHEGYSFCTMTLPILSDYLERGIEEGRLGTGLSKTFKFQARRRLPQFLGGFFSRVFDDTGYLRINACADAILAVRQISRSFKKIFEICDAQRNAAAATRYLHIEEELKAYDSTVLRSDPILDATAARLGRPFLNAPRPVDQRSWVRGTSDPVDDFDQRQGREPSNFRPPLGKELVCRHGPGVTADRRTPNGRFSIRTWPQRSMDLFPLADHALPNWGCYSDLGDTRICVEEEEPPVRVVFVPKTALTPRVIAIEPSHMQYLQQSVLSWMVSDLESGPLTQGHINFSDQSINQQLACRGSISKWLATIDMKDASDRVHKDLARRILGKTAYGEYLFACRSRSATLPDGTTVELRKFASMGSATCFPVEAYVFFCLILSAIHIHQKQIPTEDSMRTIARDVWVYGDDIVIPSPHVDFVCDYLESYGLLVNRNKSFSKSHFRESCGADFYSGQAVKPVYFRQHLPRRKQRWTPKQLMAWTSTSNQLYMAGWWGSSQLIRDWIEEETGRIPRIRTVLSDDQKWDPPGGVSFTSVAFNTELRWSHDLQSFGWKILDFKAKRQADPVETYSGGLFKAFQNINLDHSTDFEFSTKRDGFTLKHRWLSLMADRHL